MRKLYEKHPSLLIKLTYFIGFLDLLGVSIRLPLFLPHLRSFGLSPFHAGLVSALYGLVQLFSSPLVGHLSDIHGRESLLLITLIVITLNNILLGISSSIFWLIIARIIAGFAKHTQTLCKSLLADVTDAKKHSQVFGTFNAFSSLGFILGPLIGGYVSDWSNGFFISSIICAILCFLSAFLCWLFFPRTKRKMAVESRSKKEAVRPFWRNSLGDVFLARFLLSFSALIYRSQFSSFILEQFGVTVKTVGFLLSFQGIISACSSGFLVDRVSRFYENSMLQLWHCSLLLSCSLLGLTLSPNLAFLMVCLVPLCISSSIIRVVGLAVTVSRSPPEAAGSIAGLGQTMISISRMASPVVGGAAQDISTYGPGFVACFISAAGSGIAWYMSWKHTKIKSE